MKKKVMKRIKKIGMRNEKEKIQRRRDSKRMKGRKMNKPLK